MSSYLKNQFKVKSESKISARSQLIPLNPSVIKPYISQISPEPTKPPRLASLTPFQEHKDSNTGSNRTLNSEKEKLLIKHLNFTASKKKTINKSNSPILKRLGDPNSDSDRLNKSVTRIEYKPYTINDYKNIKPEKYYVLGGLGPSKIGTDDWCKKKELYIKRAKYGKQTYYSNAANLPIKIKSNKIFNNTKNSRYRALEFARTIVKPPLKVQITLI